MKTNYIFKARWLQGVASENGSKKMQVNPRKSLLKEGLPKDESSTRLRVDYVSITSRLRVWQVISSRMAAVFLLLLTLSIGNAWGTDYFTDNFSTATGNSGMSSRTGWGSFTNCYNHYGSAVRMGTSSKSGSITKTAMAAIGSTPTTIVVRFAAKRWNTDNVGLNITVNNAGTANATSIALSSQTSTGSPGFSFDEKDYYEITITGATSSTTITFSTSTTLRVLLGDVTISSASANEYEFKYVDDAGDIGAGDYLIVYNNTNALNDHYGNIETNTYSTYTSVSSYYNSSTKSIASNNTTEALVYKVYSTTNGYAIRKAFSSEFLGNSSNNTGAYLRWDRNFTTSQNEWTLGVNSIVSARNSSYAIRYNSGSPRFAIYGPSGESAVQLFKKALVPVCSDPTINTHPTGGVTYAQNAVATALSVTATKNGSGPDLTYQWYSNTTDNNTTGTSIDGATSASYTPPTTIPGTKYYYCVVSSGRCSATSNTASVTITGPMITVSETSRAFGGRKVNGGPYTMTFTVSGSSLAGNIGLTVSGTNAGMFSVSPTSLTPTAGSVSSQTITVSYSPTGAGLHSATINITSTDAVTKTVTLSGTGKWEVAWVSNGGSVATTLVGNNTKPTFPDAPSSCDGTSTTFVGWTKTTWSGKQAQSYIDGLTGDAVVHTSNSTMANITANGTTYHAVFAKKTGSEVTDLINRALVVGANSSIGTNNNSTWATATVNGSSSGAKYFIRSMGLNNATNYAIRWNANGYLYCSTAPSTGYKLKSITVTTTGTKAVALFAATSAYAAAASATSLGDNLSATTSGATYSLTTAQLASNYTCVGINGTESSTEVVSISITYSNATYSDYLTTCCENIITLNTPTITGTGATISFDKSSPVLTCSAAQDVTASLTVTNGYKVTALSFTLSAGTYTIDPAISTPYTSSQDFTLSFAQNHAAATLTTSATVEALHDKYKDYLHGNATIDKEGNYGTAPSLSSQTAATDAGCKDNHYKFKGWVAESDVNTDGTLKGGYVLIAGGATGKYATGATYIAVWAEEVE